MGRDSPCTLQLTDARHAGPQTILSQYRRLPGFHSEFVGLETMNESMTQIGVEDFLNGDCHTASSPPSLQVPCMSLARRRVAGSWQRLLLSRAGQGRCSRAGAVFVQIRARACRRRLRCTRGWSGCWELRQSSLSITRSAPLRSPCGPCERHRARWQGRSEHGSCKRLFSRQRFCTCPHLSKSS